MNKKERVILLGQLFSIYDESNKDNLEQTIIWKMMQKVKKGKSPILEGYYQSYDMPRPYDKHQSAIWEYLESIVDKKTTPVQYAANHYHQTFSTPMGYQMFAVMMINITYQRVSEDIIKSLEQL